jgi:hypothetical protein
MSSGWVLGTMRITTCAPRLCSNAVSLASSASRCAAVSVPVPSITCAVSAGTGCTPPCAQAASGSQAASNRPIASRAPKLDVMKAAGCRIYFLLKSTTGGVEICASFCTEKLGLTW